MSPVAVDLFAGAGGATQGLRDAGFDVRVAVELDREAASTWVSNHPGVMLEADVRFVSGELIMNAGGFGRGELDLLKACPPCQGFSTLRGSRLPDAARNDLVLDTIRLVRELMPRAVLIENVPGLRKDNRFDSLVQSLEELGYSLQDYLVNADELGVPQRRRRLVVIAVLGSRRPPEFSQLIPLAGRRPRMTAGQALEAARYQSAHPAVGADAWRQPSGLVAERIAAVPVAGNRFDLPEHLQLACHRNLRTKSGEASKSAGGSYGRIRADLPSPTMTTRCTTPACGSFIHPTENRGISLREASALQTFPLDYTWVGNYGSIERQIGNAVPVWMAEDLGKAVLSLLDENESTVQ
jgi:DNA (cytosine-5)-methyltransferase 1